MIGDYNLIRAGIKEFKDLVESTPKDGNRPASDLQFVLWKAIETRAGGRLDPKRSGMDQSNGNGMKSVENCGKVFDAMLGMYPRGHEVHEWLREVVPKWKRLGNALFDISEFLKSQRKRSPSVLDEKLLRLWCRWEDAFPGVGFNKYHGAFCTVRNYVHRYEMTGRISEESHEAYNATMADVKTIVRCMPCDEKRVEKIAERTQGNLKGEVATSRLEISRKRKGKERGLYKARRVHRHGRAVVSCGRLTREIEGDAYFVLNSGNLLLERWRDVYEWYLGGRAPDDWIERFNRTAPEHFTEVDLLGECNSKLV